MGSNQVEIEKSFRPESSAQARYLRFARFARASVVGILFVFCVQTIAQDETERAVAITQGLAKRIGECPRREVVGQFKKEWVKEAWGPPKDVKVDVEKTNSVVHPYRGIVEFSLVMSYGPHRKTKEKAAGDAYLKPLLGGRYRNLYDITKGGASLAAREVRGVRSEQWEPRPAWSDACWDEGVSDDRVQ